MTDHDRLQRLLELDVVPWVPAKEADQPRLVVGTVVKVSTGEDRYDAENTIVFVELEPNVGDHLWRVAGYHSSLNTELRRLKLRVGDTLGVRYEGKKESSKGKGDFHAYRVIHERGEGAESEPAEALAVVPPPVDDTPPMEGPPDPFTDEELF